MGARVLQKNDDNRAQEKCRTKMIWIHLNPWTIELSSAHMIRLFDEGLPFLVVRSFFSTGKHSSKDSFLYS